MTDPKAWLREPLLHFLVAGAALFALYSYLNPNAFVDDSTIVVDQARIEQLRQQFVRTWQRPPSEQELAGLVDSFVIEEILYRQAVAMGLDAGDGVIRRRLSQKMEFITLDAAALPAPSDAELTQFLQDNATRYQRDARYSFEQLFISTDGPEAQWRQRLGDLQARLQRGEAVAGDRSQLARVYEAAPAYRVNATFGQEFAERLAALAPQQWQPVTSGLGLHLVRLQQVLPAQLPALAEVRDVVERDWLESRSRELKAGLIDHLKQQYTIVVQADGVGRL